MLPRKVDDRVKLLHGPYRVPRLAVGGRAPCLYQDCLVYVTGWTDGPIPWPRCRPVDVRRSHPTLLVDEELARAVRLESAAAIRHWWGVSVGVVWRWRKAMGVTRTNNPGSVRRQRAASAKGADTTRGVPLPPDQVERRSRTARELNLGRHLLRGFDGRYHKARAWTAAEDEAVRTLPPKEVARRTGRSLDAVYWRRGVLGVSRRNGR
jgi:hypothetical protein